MPIDDFIIKESDLDEYNPPRSLVEAATKVQFRQYRPSEIIHVFENWVIAQGHEEREFPIILHGLYYASGTQEYKGEYYDRLRDPDNAKELTILIHTKLRNNLKSGCLVDLCGNLDSKIDDRGNIQILFHVSRVMIVKDQVVDKDEVKRFELREVKSSKGFKNVDNILEGLLFNDTHPKIALLLASSSITLTDFEAGINAAKVSMDFIEERVTFTRTQELCNKLKSLDIQGFDAIALVRGGGIDPNTDVDKPEVVETVVSLNTPFICSVGHGQEKIFLRQVSDKWTATPQGLGQYLSELVESVSERKSKSRAALTEQIKKQFQKQIEDSNKKNKELLEQIGKMTKQQEEQTKANKENIDKINEQNKKNLETQQKKNDEALAKFQAQSKQQMEQSKKQNEELQKQLANLSKSQKESLDKLTEQNKQTNTLLEKERQHSVELERQLATKPNYTSTYIIIAIVALIIGFIIAQIIK